MIGQKTLKHEQMAHFFPLTILFWRSIPGQASTTPKKYGMNHGSFIPHPGSAKYTDVRGCDPIKASAELKMNLTTRTVIANERSE
jgi:hypothetical protein